MINQFIKLSVRIARAIGIKNAAEMIYNEYFWG